MAIQPIISANYSSSRATLSFGQRNSEKRQNTNFIKSAGMAIPLSTLIAMSPLNTSAANNNGVFWNEDAKVETVYEKGTSIDGVRRTKASDGSGELVTIGDGKETYFLEFKSNTKDGRIQKIKLSKSGDLDAVDVFRQEIFGTDSGKSSKPREKVLKEIRQVIFDLYGDDGKLGGTIDFEQLMIENSGIGYSSDKLINFLKDFVNGKVQGLKNDGAIKLGQPIKRNLSVGSIGNLTNGVRNPDWLNLGREISEQWGNTILSTDIETKHGKYTIFAVNTDENNEDFEAVVVQKEGEGAFKVAGLQYANISIEDNVEIGDFNMGIVELYKRNSKQKVRILDQKLFETLWQVTNDTRYNNAYPAKMISSKMLLLGNGIVSTKN